MKKLKKIVLLILMCLFINNTKVSAKPVNTAFADDNFYQKVIEAYNKENKTSYTTKHNLTDAELRKIKNLDCYQGGVYDRKKLIKNTKGLEKLTELESLTLAYNEVKELDITANTKLKILEIFNTEIKYVDVSNNEQLQVIVVEPLYADNYFEIPKVIIKSTDDADKIISAFGKEILEVQNDLLIHVTDMFQIKNILIRDDLDNVITGSVNDYIENHEIEYIELTYEIKETNSKYSKFLHYILPVEYVTEETTPVNTNFDDINFYKCVIDAYNGENNTTYPITHNLTDEELRQITQLECYQGGVNKKSKLIKSTRGLEKLTELESLTLAYNDIDELDISANTKLRLLEVYNNNIKNIDVSNNTLLETIAVESLYGDNYNEIAKINLNSTDDIDHYIQAFGKEIVIVKNDMLLHVTDMFEVRNLTIMDDLDNVITGSVNNYVENHEIEFIHLVYEIKIGRRTYYNDYILNINYNQGSPKTKTSEIIDDSIDKAISERKETYTKTNGNYEISFKETKGNEFDFVVKDLLNRENLNLTEEEYEEKIDMLKDEIKRFGSLVEFYDIKVTDSNDKNVSKGTFRFKIKLSDEMKEYNSFKLVYVNEELVKKDVVRLTEQDGYLIGELPHLSAYALVGENIDETAINNGTIENPKTGQNISVLTCVLIIVAATSGYIYTKKKYSKI